MNDQLDLLPELGFYGLAGHTESPADLLEECRTAEAVGLGSVFLSERFNVKEAATLSGAAAAVTSELGVATGVTNHNTRHPLLSATWGATMHRLSGGRFALGIGRGFDFLFDVIGAPRITTAQMEDVIGLWRRLWAGETVLGHDGPAGRFPYLSLGESMHEDVPVLVAALGPRTMEWAGGVADGVILHTFFGDAALAECVARIRRGAERAGRDPAAVRVWSVLAVVAETGDPAHDEERWLRAMVGRLATYLQGYGQLLVDVNGWDPAVLERFRSDEVVRSVPGAIDAVATLDQLRHVAGLLPAEWLAASATGSARRCADRLVDQFDTGADGVILHAGNPLQQAPVVHAYRGLRTAIAGRFDGRVPNPGR